MQNKIGLKKMLIISIIIIIAFITLLGILYQIQYRAYTIQFNERLNCIVAELQEKYPNISQDDIIQIFNSTEKEENDFFREYGINLKEDALLLKNDELFQRYWILNLGLVISLGISLVIIFVIYNHKKNEKLIEITNYIEQINQDNE